MVEREISAHQVLVDDEDAHLLDAYRWHVAVSSNGQRQVTHSLPGGKKVYLHRLITQAPSGMVVDHVNRNPMDNRRENLRVCRQMQNSWNRVASKSKRSTDTKGRLASASRPVESERVIIAFSSRAVSLLI